MKKDLFLPLLLAIVPLFSYSQTDDDNVIINSAIENYDFSQKGNNVIITKYTDAEYIATKKGDEVPVAEFYDKQSEIVKADVDGSAARPYYGHLDNDEVFYSDTKICYYALPFKYKNKSIKVQFKKIIKDPRYFGTVYFADPYFIKSKIVKFNVPEWLELDIIEKNFNGNIVKDKVQNGKFTVYKYIITSQKATKTEPNMLGRSYIYPHLLVRMKSAKLKDKTERYFDTLDDQYAWYKMIIDSLKTDKEAIKSKSDEIIAGSKTDMEKVTKLLSWVQDNIRYIAFEDGIAAFKPDEAQEVIRKKYGDCKGMANLTKELLTAQGFDAHLTWLGTSHLAYDYSTPSLVVDNHMICTLFYNGKTYFLDPTIDYLLPGEYPHTIQGRQALIQNGDKYILKRIPEFQPIFNKDSLYCEYKIEDGKLIGKTNYNFFGESKFKILSIYHHTPKDKRELMLKSFFEKNNVLDKMENIDVSGLENNAESVNIKFDVTNQSTIQPVNNEIYLGLDIDKDMNELTFDTLKRVNDFLFTYKHNIVRHIVLNVPQNYTVTYKPTDFEIDNSKYHFSIHYTEEKGKITYDKKIIIKDLLIKKDEFKKWNNDIKNLNKAFLEQIVLTKKQIINT
ncbi:conserved exported hypothetical protein [uncultured Paludibacter sp.]|nr:conserved exported hypothetical protein [uncultured Paludibacter sp.]